MLENLLMIKNESNHDPQRPKITQDFKTFYRIYKLLHYSISPEKLA
jgi:hypothetical protein